MKDKLVSIMAEADAAESNLKKSEQQLADLIAEEQAIIVAASGPDDEAALEKLSVSAGKQSVARRQINLYQHEGARLKVLLLDEATKLRHAMAAALRKRRDDFMARYDKGMQEFFPNQRKREAAIRKALIHSVPEELFAIRNALTIADYGFIAAHQTERAYAQWILGKATECEKLLAK